MITLNTDTEQFKLILGVQDNRGFMWFAMANRLNKCNGNKFTIYRKNGITSLFR